MELHSEIEEIEERSVQCDQGTNPGQSNIINDKLDPGQNLVNINSR